MLPFTHTQFVEVFTRYNESVWPAAVMAYLLGIAVMAAILAPWQSKSRFVASVLALMWFWTGLVYHGVHFSSINPAAYLFGALFVVQAILLLWCAMTGSLRLGATGTVAPWIGWALIFYAAVLYPLLGLWAGYGFAQLPMFGITPCPLTLFTFGVLLLAKPPVPRVVLIVPLAWSLIGGSAAALLHVPQDWLLLASGLSVLLLWRRGRASRLGGAVAR